MNVSKILSEEFYRNKVIWLLYFLILIMGYRNMKPYLSESLNFYEMLFVFHDSDFWIIVIIPAFLYSLGRITETYDRAMIILRYEDKGRWWKDKVKEILLNDLRVVGFISLNFLGYLVLFKSELNIWTIWILFIIMLEEIFILFILAMFLEVMINIYYNFHLWFVFLALASIFLEKAPSVFKMDYLKNIILSKLLTGEFTFVECFNPSSSFIPVIFTFLIALGLYFLCKKIYESKDILWR